MENDGPLPKTMPPWTLLPTWIVMLHICSKTAVQTMPRVPKQRCPIWWMPGLQVRQDHSMPWWTAGAMLRRPCWCALRRMSRRLLVLLVGWTQNVHRFWLLELLRIFFAFEVTFFSWFTLFVYWPANEFFFFGFSTGKEWAFSSRFTPGEALRWMTILVTNASLNCKCYGSGALMFPRKEKNHSDDGTTWYWQMRSHWCTLTIQVVYLHTHIEIDLDNKVGVMNGVVTSINGLINGASGL